MEGVLYKGVFGTALLATPRAISPPHQPNELRKNCFKRGGPKIALTKDTWRYSGTKKQVSPSSYLHACGLFEIPLPHACGRQLTMRADNGDHWRWWVGDNRYRCEWVWFARLDLLAGEAQAHAGERDAQVREAPPKGWGKWERWIGERDGKGRGRG